MLKKFNNVSSRILVLTLALTCNFKCLAQNNNTGAISGGVLNIDLSAPIARVAIRVTNLSTGFAKGVSTGKDGT